jgi:hypothetical protein
MNTQPKQPGQVLTFHRRNEPPALPRSELPSDPSRSASRPRGWLVQVDQELRLVEGEQQLMTLIAHGRVTGATPAYEIAALPRPLGDIPDLAHLLPEPVTSEPPIRMDHRSRERALFSEELAVLNRPLENDVEYYDEIPVRRWPKRLAVTVVFAAAALGAYPLVASRLGGWRALATTRLTGLASAHEKVDSPPKLEGATPAPAPVPAPVGKSDVKEAAPPATVPQRAVPGPTSVTTSSARVVPARPSDAPTAEPEPPEGAAVDDSNAVGRHNTGHKAKGRSSRNRAASRHS